MDSITTFITSVGFPIACCVALAWYVKYVTDKHEKEISKLKESIDNNTKVIAELITYLKGRENNG